MDKTQLPTLYVYDKSNLIGYFIKYLSPSPNAMQRHSESKRVVDASRGTTGPGRRPGHFTVHPPATTASDPVMTAPRPGRVETTSPPGYRPYQS